MNKAIEIGKRIKLRREELNMTQEDLGKFLHLNKSTIQRYETGQVKNIKLPVIQSIAIQLQVNPNWLALKTDNPSMDDGNIPSPDITEAYTTFPVIGDVAAGYEQIAAEDWEGDKIEIPISWLGGRPKSDYMVLRVKGDSMFPEYQDGDKVLVLRQDTMDYSGQIGVVIFDDDHITVKKIEYKPGEDWMRLVPINPAYPRELIENEALEHCRIRGIPVKLIRDITK